MYRQLHHFMSHTAYNGSYLSSAKLVNLQGLQVAILDGQAVFMSVTLFDGKAQPCSLTCE